MINKYHKSFALIWIQTDLEFCLPSRKLLCHPPVCVMEWVLNDLQLYLYALMYAQFYGIYHHEHY